MPEEAALWSGQEAGGARERTGAGQSDHCREIRVDMDIPRRGIILRRVAALILRQIQVSMALGFS